MPPLPARTTSSAAAASTPAAATGTAAALSSSANAVSTPAMPSFFPRVNVDLPPVPTPAASLPSFAPPPVSPLSRDEKPSMSGSSSTRRRFGWGKGLAARGLATKAAAPTTPGADEPTTPGASGTASDAGLLMGGIDEDGSGGPGGGAAESIVGGEAGPEAAAGGAAEPMAVDPPHNMSTAGSAVSLADMGGGGSGGSGAGSGFDASDSLVASRLASDNSSYGPPLALSGAPALSGAAALSGAFLGGNPLGAPIGGQPAAGGHGGTGSGQPPVGVPAAMGPGGMRPAAIGIGTPAPPLPPVDRSASRLMPSLPTTEASAVPPLGSLGTNPLASASASTPLPPACSPAPASLAPQAPPLSHASPAPFGPPAAPAAPAAPAPAPAPPPAPPVRSGPTRNEMLAQICELESSIEELEEKIEDAETKREAARRAVEAEQARQAAAARTAASPSTPGHVPSESRADSASDPSRPLVLSELVDMLYAVNTQKAESARGALLQNSGLSVEEQREATAGVLPADQPVYQANLARKQRLFQLLSPLISRRVQQQTANAAELREKYASLQATWEGSLARRERERDARLQRKEKQAKEAEEAEAAAAKKGTSLSRSSSGVYGGGSRRGQLGSSDAVRSEEEMMAVIAQLAAAEKREKSDEWIARQCARPTPMILEPLRLVLPRYEKRCMHVEDPLGEERERKRMCVWTAAERKVFAEKWAQHPKNFRKIKSCLDLAVGPFKTVGECARPPHGPRNSPRGATRRHARGGRMRASRAAPSPLLLPLPRLPGASPADPSGTPPLAPPRPGLDVVCPPVPLGSLCACARSAASNSTTARSTSSSSRRARGKPTDGATETPPRLVRRHRPPRARRALSYLASTTRPTTSCPPAVAACVRAPATCATRSRSWAPRRAPEPRQGAAARRAVRTPTRRARPPRRRSPPPSPSRPPPPPPRHRPRPPPPPPLLRPTLQALRWALWARLQLPSGLAALAPAALAAAAAVGRRPTDGLMRSVPGWSTVSRSLASMTGPR